MAAKIIHIDSYIGRWGYGKELLRFDLDGTQKEGAVIRISSLGGDVFHALDMYNQIAAHGNVEVIFAGPSASAATFLAMSARKVSIVDNCFLLVHKVMAGVENYGHFNEDELDALIADLKTLKKENREFDRAIAHIYSKRTGKSHQEIIAQMKANTWISAPQALEFGFVDQVIEPDQKVNYHSERFVAMVSASELPPFPAGGAQTIQPIDQTSTAETHENQKSESMIHCKTLNSVLEVDALESTSEGTYLNQEQLHLLDSRLEATLQAEHNYEEAILERDNARSETDSLKAQVTELTTARDSAISERDTAIENQRTAEESTHQATASQEALTVSLDAIDPTVASADSMEAKVEAIRQLLSRLPGAGVPGILDRKDKPAKTDGVDWTLINSLPHNQSVDKNQ